MLRPYSRLINACLSVSGNPLVCSCSSYSQKIWMRQHRKWLDTDRRGVKVGPQCREPHGLAKRYLLSVKDSELCPLPSVNSLAFTSRDPFNFLITWESPDTNMTGLRGFIVAYHRLDKNDQVKKYRVAPQVRGFRIEAVADNAVYLVCVITRGSAYGIVRDGVAAPAASASNEISPYFGSIGGDSMEDYYDEHDESEEEEEEEDLDGQFYVMPLEWTRSKREASGGDDEFSIGSFAEQMFGFGKSDNDESDASSGHGNNDSLNAYLSYPSSNDTELLVSKPAVVNLGSQSSKCIRINTPPDPAKLSLIDNKRMSVVIGVTMGLIVFAGIIIAIVFIKPLHSKDDDVVEDADEGSSLDGAAAAGGSKSPKTSSSATPAGGSFLSARLAGTSAGMAMATAKAPTKPEETPQQPPTTPKPAPPPVAPKPSKQTPPPSRHPMKSGKKETRARTRANTLTNGNGARQSSTESASFLSNASMPAPHSRQQPPPPMRHSRHNSNDGYNDRDPLISSRGGQQSWQGSPREFGYQRRRSNHYEGLHGRSFESAALPGSSFSTTLPRRNTEMSMAAARLQHQVKHINCK